MDWRPFSQLLLFSSPLIKLTATLYPLERYIIRHRLNYDAQAFQSSARFIIPQVLKWFLSHSPQSRIYYAWATATDKRAKNKNIDIWYLILQQ